VFPVYACPIAQEAYLKKGKKKKEKRTSSTAGGRARDVREGSSRKRMSAGASTPVSFTRLFNFRFSSGFRVWGLGFRV
jgi:hypothetical protein